MKFDPYNHEKRYKDWKENVSKKGIVNIGEENSKIILQYLNDMERGINVSAKSVKGPRSYTHLNKTRQRMCYFAIKLNELYGLKRIVDIDEEKLISFFAEMRSGIIQRIKGGNYRSLDTYAKIFKAFWHWWMKVNRKNKVEIIDITCDLDTRQEKPEWVYLTEEEVRILAENCKPYYKTLIMFLYDTGIRAPTELMNIKVSDFYNDFKELQIRDEISKTFGRRIKLMICSSLIRDYIKINNLKSGDFIFTKSPSSVNAYLKENATKVFGTSISPAGEKYSSLTMYDFRHCSCCYWLPRYKSESALKYRFGWKKSDKIHYYSELLGMKDTITEEDLVIDSSKPAVEKKLENTEREKDILQERLNVMEQQMRKMMELAMKLGVNAV